MAFSQPQSSTNHADQVVYTLSKTHLFSELNPAELEPFIQDAQIKNVTKHSILFLHDDPADFFYVVSHGWVKLFRETLDGVEGIVDVVNDGNLLGETSLFDGDTYTYGAEVVEDSTLISIPIATLKQEIEKNPALSMQMFSVMSRFRRQLDKELEHRDIQNAPQRIGCFLLRLCKPGAEENIQLHLPYDKTLIASRLGMKPETFSRALSRLREETGIRVNGAMVEIDHVNQLSHYSCRACSSSYPCQDLH